MKRVDVALGIVYRDSRLLICRRRQNTRLAGYWEFPGGKLESGETVVECLQRELREELDIAADPLIALPVIEHDYPDIRVRLHPFLCAYKAGEPKALGCDEFRWVQPAQLMSYEFPPANLELLQQVKSRLSR
jgi:mutator protein MutT